MPEPMIVLGFDFGLRRIGVAVGQRVTGTATALAVVANRANGTDWTALDALLAQWRPQVLVVGVPLTREGEEQPMTHAAKAFADLLHARYHLPVELADERFSSRVVDTEFAAARRAGTARRKDAATLDAQAARHILEQWLNQTGTGNSNT